MYAINDVEYEPSFYTSQITEWKMILCAHSKMPEVAVLKKQDDNVSAKLFLTNIY